MRADSILRTCPTLELRSIGSETYLFRSRDRKAWVPDICKHELFWQLWTFFSTPHTQQDGIDALPDLEPEKIAAAIEGMSECGLLEKTNPTQAYDRMLECGAARHQLQSMSYHLSSSRVDWIDYSNGDDIKARDLDIMDRKVRDEAVPANYKLATNSEPVYDLSQVIPADAFGAPNGARIVFGKQRCGNRTELSLDALNFVLNLTFAQTDSVTMYATGDHVRKPVPSGGARHPTEAYVGIAENVPGLLPGIYHYNVKFHRLDRIDLSQRSVCRLMNASCILSRSRSKPAKAVILHSCIFARSMFRYRESRSYRVMNFDLGHIHANEVIACKLIGLDFNECYSVPEPILETLLSLDPLHESIMSSFIIH